MPATGTLAPIQPDVLYPLATFQDTSGLGRASLKTARDNGLIVRKTGNRKYVLGSDFIDFLKKHGKADGQDGEA